MGDSEEIVNVVVGDGPEHLLEIVGCLAGHQANSIALFGLFLVLRHAVHAGRKDGAVDAPFPRF